MPRSPQKKKDAVAEKLFEPDSEAEMMDLEEAQRLTKQALDEDQDMDDADADADAGDEDGSEGEGEDEYEIEAILDHKVGHFKAREYAYFVKWKGYDETENSWVAEPDAGNANDLITAYWKQQKRQKGPDGGRKSVGGKGRPSTGGKSASGRGRLSTADPSDVEVEEVETKPVLVDKKPVSKGRKSNTKPEPVEDSDIEIQELAAKPTPKASGSRRRSAAAEEDEDEVEEKPAPKATRGRKRSAPVDEDEDDEIEAKPAPKTTKGRKSIGTATAKDSDVEVLEKPAPKKPGPKPKPIARKSAARDDDDDSVVEEVKPKPAPKRAPRAASARKSASAPPVEEKEDDDEIIIRAPQKKKPRLSGPTKPTTASRTNGKTSEASVAAESSGVDEDMTVAAAEPEEPDEEDGVMGDMTQYMQMQDWSGLIRKVDTIEKRGEGEGENAELMVYLVLNDGSKHAHSSKVCRKRCPDALFDFYEKNLRWRQTPGSQV